MAEPGEFPEGIQKAIAEAVELRLKNGYGLSCDAPPKGDYPSHLVACPHDGCQWQMTVLWQDDVTHLVTRMRGTAAIDRLIQNHLMTHVERNFSAST